MSDTAKAPVVVIGDIRPHPNAERLELTDVGGYQMVIGKGSFLPGDLAVFIQPDAVVPQTEPFAFIWEQHATKTLGQDGIETNDYDKTSPRYRRVKPRRLRGEWSEGLLMPVADLGYVNPAGQAVINTEVFSLGDDVASIIGLTRWEDDRDELAKGDSGAVPKRHYPKSVKGWFFYLLYKIGLRSRNANEHVDTGFDYPVYDVNAWKNNKRLIEFHDRVMVTEKIHGSNARYVSIDGKLYAGSHHFWKAEGANIWWKATRTFPQIAEWCHANPGKVIYGEVGPTQKGYSYGMEPGATFFYAFDIYDPTTRTWTWPGNEGFTPTVPTLGLYDWDKDLVARLVDGPSIVPGAKNIREGIVIRNLRNRVTLKVKSNTFLEKDGNR